MLEYAEKLDVFSNLERSLGFCLGDFEERRRMFFKQYPTIDNSLLAQLNLRGKLNRS